MRTYEKTHSWLTFQIDLRVIEYATWISLGEAQSKCTQISGVPLRPAVAQQLQKMYLAKGVLATTAIEGNTLSESEVIQHLDGKLKLPPSKEYLSKEIDNIVTACNKIVTDILIRDKAEISFEKIMEYNKFVLDGLSLNESVVPGQIRTYSVGVGSYRAVPAEDCEFLLQKLCAWLNEFQIPENNRITFGLLKAIVAHIYFVWIHPFGDGNGRTARLIEFQLLLEAGIPILAAHLLSNFYNQTRTEYYRQLNITTKKKWRYLRFYKICFQWLCRSIKRAIRNYTDATMGYRLAQLCP